MTFLSRAYGLRSARSPFAALQATRDDLLTAIGWPMLCNLVYKDLAACCLTRKPGIRESSGIFRGISIRERSLFTHVQRNITSRLGSLHTAVKNSNLFQKGTYATSHLFPTSRRCADLRFSR